MAFASGRSSGGRGAGIVASADFTPAASAYGAGAVMDVPKELIFKDRNDVVVPPGSLIRILATVLKIDQTALQASEGAYSAYLYSVTPPSAQADKATWTLASADLASYRDALSLGTPVDLGAACHIKTQLTDRQDIKLATGKSSLWARLVTTPAFTPTAVARQLILYGIVL